MNLDITKLLEAKMKDRKMKYLTILFLFGFMLFLTGLNWQLVHSISCIGTSLFKQLITYPYPLTLAFIGIIISTYSATR